MAEAPDPAAALVGYLRAQGLAEGRIWAGELPEAEIQQMPRAAILLWPAGGGLLTSTDKVWGDKRFDVDCYAASIRSSWQLYREVERALKGLQREVYAGVLLHWARVSADGQTLRDPRTDWPLTASSWQVMVGEAAA